MTTDDDATPMMINCGTHGTNVSAIVCRHHLEARDRVVGFIENTDDPLDLQAWCAECEALFLTEGDKTDAFLEFNCFAVVCIECYSRLKSRHSNATSQP